MSKTKVVQVKTDNFDNEVFIRLDKILEFKNLEKNMVENKWLAHNKNYMSIAVSVLTTSRVARNNGGAARLDGKATRSRQLHIVPTVMAN